MDNELESLINSVDADDDGFTDLQKFIELNRKDVDSNDVLESLGDAFSVFDIDKTGKVKNDDVVIVTSPERRAVRHSEQNP
ncbi:putative EF-hand domain pair protein [Helianthus anomalus]